MRHHDGGAGAAERREALGDLQLGGLVEVAGVGPVLAQDAAKPVYRCPGPPVLYTDAISPQEARAAYELGAGILVQCDFLAVIADDASTAAVAAI